MLLGWDFSVPPRKGFGLRGLDGLQAEEATLMLPLEAGELEHLTERGPSLHYALAQARAGARMPSQGATMSS